MEGYDEMSKLISIKKCYTYLNNTEIIPNNERIDGIKYNNIQNKINTVCLKLFYSDISPKLYLVLFISNLLVVISNIILDDPNIIVITIELSITLLFGLEIYITYILRGSKYYKTVEGILDICMLALCLCFIMSSVNTFYSIKDYINTERIADVAKTLLCILRTIVQSTRLIHFYIRHNNLKRLLQGYTSLPLHETDGI